MKKEKENIDVLFLGRFTENDMLSGPEKTAKRIFSEHSKCFKSCFIQYFFDGRKYSSLRKIFGKDNSKTINGSEILTLGLFRIIAELLKRRPAIIHIMTYERFAVTALICRVLSGAKIVYNVHGVIAFENTELKKIGSFLRLKDRICEKLLLKYSDILIFYSENSIDIAEKYFKIDESKAVILSGGIDEIFCAKMKCTSVSSGRLKAVIQYLNLLKRSSMEFLNDALSKLTFPIELYVIGAAGSAISQTNGDTKLVHVDNMNTSQLAEFYSDKDIFLSLNKYDTFSISTAEAMASGLVPVVTEETGISRYIENRENGFTVKFGDVEKLGQILDHLHRDSEIVKEISDNARKISEMLSWHDVYDTYRNIYTSLLK